MKESTVWKKISRAYSLPRSKRNINQRYVTYSGLCRAVGRAIHVWARYKPYELDWRMRTRMRKHPPKGGFIEGYWWEFPFDEGPDMNRATFAAKMAKLAERDEKKLSCHRTKRKK